MAFSPGRLTGSCWGAVDAEAALARFFFPLISPTPAQA
jgi:hypothetical protein